MRKENKEPASERFNHATNLSLFLLGLSLVALSAAASVAVLIAVAEEGLLVVVLALPEDAVVHEAHCRGSNDAKVGDVVGAEKEEGVAGLVPLVELHSCKRQKQMG